MKGLFSVKRISIVVVVFLIFIAVWGVSILRGSLALTDGSLVAPKLSAPVLIERDAQGIPTLISDDRQAIAYGLGFVHAQERFFQMDVLRRNSAGELSQLIGGATLDHDQRIRVHRFRARAERNLKHLTDGHLDILQAYADGVNQGLAQLSAQPFEYQLLNSAPAAWVPADSLLVLFSMYMTLQDEFGESERYHSVMADVLPKALYEFLQPTGGRWDAPLIGEAFEPSPIPAMSLAQLLPGTDPLVYQPLLESDDYAVGSNNWAVGGALTTHGGAIIADDMHLNIAVPNIWYRASWPLPNGLTMTGASLPGTPAMIVGSNSKVAWGFTNTTGDWSDVVLLETDAATEHYTTAQGPASFEVFDEVIHVKGEPDHVLQVKETQWGPVIGQNHRGQWMALRWVAHDVNGSNVNILAMESVTNVEQALAKASTFGMPAQNFVGGDVQGNIGWTVAGPIPRRVGLTGEHWQNWAGGDKSWQGYRSYPDVPHIYNPSHHRLWTANARTMSGDYLAMMGDAGGYALGARQQQIRDALFAKERFSEQDLLDIQLDDRALFLAPWHEHLSALIEQTTLPLEQERQVLLDVLTHWGARASNDSVGYRLVRNFRLKTIEYSVAPFVSVLAKTDSSFNFDIIDRSVEYPVWSMLTEQPEHLLNPEFDSWQALQVAALNSVLMTMAEGGLPLHEQTWGAENTANIVHPLVKAVPALKPLLSMPADRLSGDSHMPRVQTPTNGASERMVVAPGREASGIFHMATGQSGHPLSPWFDDGHSDWVEGKASAFLSGPAQHQLRLTPP